MKELHLTVVIFIAALINTTCNSNPASTAITTTQTDSNLIYTQAPNKEPVQTHTSQDTTYETENYMVDKYIVFANTDTNYWKMEQEMFALSHKTGIPIDTLNRYYNSTKKEIIAVQDDNEGIYNEEYYLRRYGDDFLSLEMLSAYQQSANSATIGIMAGLFDNQQSADSMATIIKVYQPAAFILKARVYMGCMH